MLSDIEIAQNCKMKNIKSIAEKLNLSEDDIECYGKYKAKINVENIKENKNGKLILVTAITPTKSGEGKTTVTIGLGVTLNELTEQKIKPYELLDKLKQHPTIAPLIEGGTIKEYSAHLIPEGGYNDNAMEVLFSFIGAMMMK